MDILKFKEDKDGAILTVSLTEDEQDFLLKYAIRTLLKEEIERAKKDEQGTDRIREKIQREESSERGDI